MLRNRQHGATLVTSLMILVMITILGLASMRTATLEERMARYSREQQVAFQAAEATLRDAERDLSDPTSARFGVISGMTGFDANCNTGTPFANNVRGLCIPASVGTVPVWRASMNDQTAIPFGQYTPNNPLPAGGVAGVARQPRYLVEGISTPIVGGSLKPGSIKVKYRVTAQAFGPSLNTEAWVQSIFQP